MLRAKGEVLEKLEMMKDVNEEAYHKVVDTVSDKYKKIKNIDPTELNAMRSDLKKHWGNIKKHLGGTTKGTKGKSQKKIT